MCKKPDDSLIGQCENNITQGLLLVSLLWNQKIVFGKSQMLSQFVFRAFLYLNSSTVHFVLNWYWTHFDKSYRENQTDASNRFCSWPLTAHQETVSYKHRTSWALSLHTFKPVCSTKFFEEKFKSAWNETETWCNFTPFSAGKNDILSF